MMLVPITQIVFQSELFGFIVVRTIIGHNPDPGDAHHVLGLKFREITYSPIRRNWSYVLGCLKVFGVF